VNVNLTLAHLLARENHFYKAGACRNPVTNVGAMVSDRYIDCNLF
jgi:hypothetical protein